MNLNTPYHLISHNGERFELSLGDIFTTSPKTLLFFYPRDNTPGCTVENKDFSCMVEQYREL
jgi:peroxiredoxin Q/BCP